MARLHKVLEEILVEAGALRPVEMGPPPAEGLATPDVKERLVEALPPRARLNERLLKLVIALHLISFLAPLLLVYFLRNSLAAVALILSVTVPFLLGITRLLSELWRTKEAVDMLITILPGLPPELAVKAVKDVYYAHGKPFSERSAIADRIKL